MKKKVGPKSKKSRYGTHLTSKTMIDQGQEWPHNKVEYLDRLEASMRSPRHNATAEYKDDLVDNSSIGDPYPEDVRRAKMNQRVVGLSSDMRSSKLYLLASSDMKVRPDGMADLSPTNNVDVLAS